LPPSFEAWLTILTADVFTSGSDLEDVAAQWLSKFKTDAPEAMTELINFILKSCGCDLQVTENDIEDTDNVEGRLTDLQQEFQAV
jgi:cohesin complex subunit SA-1/2